MSLKHVVVLTTLLISAIGTAGCTGSPSAPAAPAPLPVATTVPGTPMPVITASPVPPAVTWPMLETPATGHPYSKTYSFHGSGTYEDFTFTTDSNAMWVFRMDPGSGYFLVSLKDARGNEIEVLPSTGTKSVWLKAGDYSFDITADSPWYITMSTP
ncbi:MAG: hypothetical protein WCB46_04060 [Methanoregula sp.]